MKNNNTYIILNAQYFTPAFKEEFNSQQAAIDFINSQPTPEKYTTSLK